MSSPLPDVDQDHVCRHCGSPIPDDSPGGEDFCCRGCKAAYELVNGLGLSSYYQRRCIDPDVKPLRPDEHEEEIDLSAHVIDDEHGLHTLHLMVEGVHCAACVWLIETVLGRQPGVHHARVNMTTRRLVLTWGALEDGTVPDPSSLIEPVQMIGYRLVPYDPQALGNATAAHEKELLRGMAVAGFAASNIMLLSVSIWAGVDMGEHTRDLFHWISALIAFPAIGYTIRPFARSALSALRHGRANMDVPVTIGVVLATLMSLWETITGGQHAYFDASISLLFFLLIGRYLDSRARGQARSAAEHLLALGAKAVTVLREDGTRAVIPPRQVSAGMTVLVAAGERIGVDGIIEDGQSDLDTSLITGETVPESVKEGTRVFAGTLNLTSPLRLKVEAVGEGTLLGEIVRMMEVAEQGRASYVALADRVARYYAPVVHTAATLTFAGWMIFGDVSWQDALLTAISVLIITCPCAVALAVPVVQVIASGRLLRRGVLLKSPTALERLTSVNTVVFDKTGTLTLGKPVLQPATDDSSVPDGWTPDDLRLAAGMAARSRHPLSRTLSAACLAPVAEGVVEHPGLGLEYASPEGTVRLGSRTFCQIEDSVLASVPPATGPEMWLVRPHGQPRRFSFADAIRSDAAEVIAVLKKRGLQVELLSGDREPVVAAVAQAVGLDHWTSQATPTGKCARLETLRAEGRKVLMVGDGLNDAPALAAAEVSLSPSTAVDVSQTAADAVFQGEALSPLLEVLHVARSGDRLMKENFVLAFAYNAITIPVAIMGLVTPLIAAVAMSTSSVVVIVNALRLARGRAA